MHHNCNTNNSVPGHFPSELYYGGVGQIDLLFCAAVKTVADRFLRTKGLDHRLSSVLEETVYTAWTERIKDAWLAKPTLHGIIVRTLIQEVQDSLDVCEVTDAREKARELAAEWAEQHQTAVVRLRWERLQWQSIFCLDT